MTTTSTEFLSDSPAATEAFAAQWAQTLQPDTAILLMGDLGAGKTTFVRGLARGLGVADPIRSPTFTLIHEYTIQQPALLKGLPFFHLDLYRIETLEQLATLGLDEILERGGVAAIEWAERLGLWNTHLPVQQAWQVRITHSGEQNRLIQITEFAAARR
ncbi:MAG: tRNA (adenosine(37)-N6)-threonylcarbamoyltransferase complex ATPase subunit type 1 TsaE [Fimbriimonadales bacterium]|nr:tRNA (adenosine(37)-N6)-threonylcarbamoyltransferase complex ATPase subunit type 1 TsaE [Fimbriimonadales bacterium]